MLDHLGFKVVDYKTARAFYDRALAPLGFGVLMELTAEQTGSSAFCGYGPAGGKPDFWLEDGAAERPNLKLHVCFKAKSRADVDAFHAAAMAAGGKDNGGPGLRPHYHPNYYGAFVLDPDGHNIEAVCHVAE